MSVEWDVLNGMDLRKDTKKKKILVPSSTKL